MKRFTRALFTAAVVLALNVLPARAADVSPLLPAETEGYMHLNVKQALESELFQKYAAANVKQALQGEKAKQMTETLGLDPLKDVDSVTAGFWGDDPQNMKALVIANGKFNLDKLMSAAKAEAAKNGDKVAIVSEGSFTLIKITNDDKNPFYVSAADEKRIVGGTDKQLVINALKVSDNKSAKPALKDGLAELVKKMDTKATMFICGLSSGKVGDIPPIPIIEDADKFKKQLEKMTSSSMTVKVTGDVAMDIVMSMKDKEAADDFGATMDDLLTKAKGLLGLVTAQAPQAKPLIADINKSLKSKVDSKDVVITMKLTGGAISKVAGSDD